MAGIKQGGLGAVGIAGGLVAALALLSLPDASTPTKPPLVTVAVQPGAKGPIAAAPVRPLPQAWEQRVEPVAGGAPPGQAGVWSHPAEFAPPE